MKQIIEIEVPDGKKAVWKDNKVVFKDIEQLKPKYPKTWGEFCNNYPIESNEHLIGDDSNICYWLGTKYRQTTCKNMLPSKKAAEAHLALMQLHQLRDCYRQGWKPNWNNDKQQKYCILHKKHKKDGEWEVTNVIALIHFLSFQKRELAEEFLNNFRDLIEQAGDLI